jgi:hypothetical protein
VAIAVGLDGDVLTDAERTHPGIVREGRLEASSAYGGPVPLPACEVPLSEPPPESLASGCGWVNQLCDLVEVRIGVAGSTVRVHAS